MATPTKKIKVKPRVQAHPKTRIWQAILEYYDEDGKRQRPSKSTGLPEKGNKKRAEVIAKEFSTELEDELNTALREKKAKVAKKAAISNPLALAAADADILFADFIEDVWLASVKPTGSKKTKEIKLTTYGGYETNVRTSIAPWFRKRSILLKDLTADHINDYYEDELERLKATSVHKFHANISKSLKFAVRRGYIDSARAIMEKVNRPKAEKYVGKFLRQVEVEKLYEAVKGHKLELGVLLGAYYGLRRSEIVGLRWESIDFAANTITIEHTVTQASVEGARIIIADDTTKTQSSLRTLPLTPILRAKLLSVQAEQEQNRKLCGRSYNKVEGKYIYTDVLGNRIKPDYLSAQFPIFLERNGFRHIRFHDLRHSCASLLLANGVSIKEIQDWLGHSTFKTTADIYAHLESDSKLAAAAALTWIDNTSLAKEAVGVT